MALMTATEVKAFLRITATTYDTLIATYLPIIEKDICEYLNNYFDDRVIYVQHAGGLAFVRGNTATSSTQADYITDDNQDFSTAGFVGGMDIAVFGGSNYGIHTIDTVSSGTMSLTSTGVLVSQDQDASYNTVGAIRIARIKWPTELKPIAAKMIWYQIDKARPDGAISERVDDYSVTYAGSNAYPEQLIRQLSKWRMTRSH